MCCFSWSSRDFCGPVYIWWKSSEKSVTEWWCFCLYSSLFVLVALLRQANMMRSNLQVSQQLQRKSGIFFYQIINLVHREERTMRKPSILCVVKFLYWEHFYRRSHDSDKSSIGNCSFFLRMSLTSPRQHSFLESDGCRKRCLPQRLECQVRSFAAVTWVITRNCCILTQITDARRLLRD